MEQQYYINQDDELLSSPDNCTLDCPARRMGEENMAGLLVTTLDELDGFETVSWKCDAIQDTCCLKCTKILSTN